MVLIAARQGVGLTGLFALKATLRVLLMTRGQCEATALLATTGALAPQRSPEGLPEGVRSRRENTSMRKEKTPPPLRDTSSTSRGGLKSYVINGTSYVQITKKNGEEKSSPLLFTAKGYPN